MPLYDYRCSACGKVREHRQKISDEPLTECPECGGEYKRIITNVGIIFKGSGFHINDYRAGGKSDEGGPKKDSPPSGKGSESKGEGSSSSSEGSGSSGSTDSGSSGSTDGKSSSSSGAQDKRVA